MRPMLVLLTTAVLGLVVPAGAHGAAPDKIKGSGVNEGWFDFDVKVKVRDGEAGGTLRVDEFGAASYDVSGRVVCAAVSGRDAVVAAQAGEEGPRWIRVVYLALRDRDGLGLGPDQAAPAFSVVPAGTPLGGLCADALYLTGSAETLDAGGVRIRDRS